MASEATIMQFSDGLDKTTIVHLTAAFQLIDSTVGMWEEEVTEACKDTTSRFAPSIITSNQDQGTIDAMKAARGQIRSILKELLIRDHLR